MNARDRLTRNEKRKKKAKTATGFCVMQNPSPEKGWTGRVSIAKPSPSWLMLLKLVDFDL